MYLIVISVARWFHRVVANPQLRAAVAGVTAAATGAIAGAVVVLGRRAVTDLSTALILAVALVIVVRIKRVPEPVLLLAAGIVGVLVHGGR